VPDEKEKTRWTSAHHWVAIWGKVIDAVTRKPVAGALVTLTSMPTKLEKTLQLQAQYFGDEWKNRMQRPDRTYSRPDGLYYFLDLPDGDYEVSASLPSCGKRYGDVHEKKRVSINDREGTGQQALRAMWLELALPSSMIRGRIYDAAKKAGVVMAEVRLKGSGERTFSGPKGAFTLGPIEASAKAERTLECFAQGYQPKEQKDYLPKDQKKQRPIVLKEPGVLDLGDISLEPARRD